MVKSKEVKETSHVKSYEKYASSVSMKYVMNKFIKDFEMALSNMQCYGKGVVVQRLDYTQLEDLLKKLDMITGADQVSSHEMTLVLKLWKLLALEPEGQTTTNVTISTEALKVALLAILGIYKGTNDRDSEKSTAEDLSEMIRLDKKSNEAKIELSCKQAKNLTKEFKMFQSN